MPSMPQFLNSLQHLFTIPDSARIASVRGSLRVPKLSFSSRGCSPTHPVGRSSAEIDAPPRIVDAKHNVKQYQFLTKPILPKSHNHVRVKGRIKTFLKYFSPVCPIHKLITDTKSFLHTHYANFWLTRNSRPLVVPHIVNNHRIVLKIRRLEKYIQLCECNIGFNGKLIPA